jgi:drug/metabolite transporter (DMT)-like permease
MDSTQRDRTIGSLCLCVTAFGWALNWPLMKLLLQHEIDNCVGRSQHQGCPAGWQIRR